MTAVEAPLQYAATNVPVFPVGPDKRPLVEHGFKSATVDPATIRRWWTRYPDAGLATPTGRGFFVLDVDRTEALAELEAEHEPLPPTVEVATPRPGSHLWLLGDGVTNSDSALPDGIHVRGAGGYVVLPPSPHENGGRYEWRTAPDEAPIAPAPEWLLQLLRSRSNGAGCGEHRAPVGLLPHGARHPYLKDWTLRMLRAGVVDQARIEAHLELEFRLACEPEPPPARGYFRELAKWAVRSRIADRERDLAQLAELIRTRREEPR